VTEDKIYLEFEHIKAILSYTPDTPEKANAKLILLTLLFTGCRYSDVYKIKPEYTKQVYMTTLGLYCAKKLINRAELARKTGITENGMYNLVENETTEIRGKELHLIAMALDIKPNELHETLFGDLKLPELKN
jgi:DNA-binding Xre family transcriptional regulator